MKCLKKEVNDMDDKWFGTVEYRIAADALSRIAENLENPTYAQVVQVLECMRDLAGEFCVFAALRERGENMGRFADEHWGNLSRSERAFVEACDSPKCRSRVRQVLSEGLHGSPREA